MQKLKHDDSTDSDKSPKMRTAGKLLGEEGKIQEESKEQNELQRLIYKEF